MKEHSTVKKNERTLFEKQNFGGRIKKKNMKHRVRVRL